MKYAVDQQQAPTPTGGASIHDLVAADIAERKAFGLAKYGARKPLVDLYQELLDACCYARQALEERSTGELPDEIIRDTLAAVLRQRDEAHEMVARLQCERNLMAEDHIRILRREEANGEEWRRIAVQVTEERHALAATEQARWERATRDAIRGRDAAEAALVMTIKERDALALRLVAAEARMLDERNRHAAELVVSPLPVPRCLGCGALLGARHAKQCALSGAAEVSEAHCAFLVAGGP